MEILMKTIKEARKRSLILAAAGLAAVLLMLPARTEAAGIGVFYVSDPSEFFSAWLNILGNCGGKGEIRLLEDIYWGNGSWEEDSRLRVLPGMDITIDLNGHTLYNHPGTYFLYAHNALFSVEGGRLALYSSHGDGAVDGRGLCYASLGEDRCGAVVDVFSGTFLLGYGADGVKAAQGGRVQIRNAANLLSFGGSDPSGGTLVNCFGGTVRASRALFSDCDGTALWGWDPQRQNGGCDVLLEECASERVSGLFSSGAKESPFSASRIRIYGGTYRTGKCYNAGVECFQQSVGNEIKNAVLDVGYLASAGSGSMTVENCDVKGGVIWESGGNLISGSRVHESTNFTGIYSAPPSTASNTIRDTQTDHCLIGVGAASGRLTLSGVIRDNMLCGISNDGADLYFTGGEILGNGSQDSAESGGILHRSGALHVRGGKISANRGAGIANSALLEQTGGTVTANTFCGVYQNGQYLLSGSAAVEKDPIYLCRGKIVEVPSALDDGKAGGFRLATADDDKAVARELIRSRIGCSRAFCGRFSLVSAALSHDASGGVFTGVRDTGAIHRGVDMSGYGGARADSLYLTGCYGLYFDEALKDWGFTADYNTEALRNETVRHNGSGAFAVIGCPFQMFYWNEPTVFSTGQDVRVYSI